MADLPPNLRPDAFAGAAEDYLRYRPPYPAALVECLVGEAAAGPHARAIDLACGPGRLTIDLAPRFGEVWAVDLEPEMIAVARAEAARRGLANVRWSVGRAEELEAPASAFSLITVGEAFHRLDRPLTLGAAMRWLAPGGVFATLGAQTFLEGEARWRRVLAGIAERWIAEAAAPAPAHATFVERQQALFAGAGFTDFRAREFEAAHEWTLEGLLGFLRSTSVLSRHALGERHTAFEDEVSAALLAADPSGRYRETLRFGCTMGRKP
ncbi:MAG TPA: class I SAM-dependent methyltransferase [Caulobacteraceae bacterium]|nr:class I SAM-dependent methyltransferase [Caulobacteraceae bacterium]